MSNNNDENPDGLDVGYFKNLGKLREQNKKNEQAIKDWHQFDGFKPSLDDMPKVLTEQELHDEAKDMTIAQAEHDKLVEKMVEVGLAQPKRRSFADKQRDHGNPEAVEKAREEQRQSQQHERKNDRKLGH